MDPRGEFGLSPDFWKSEKSEIILDPRRSSEERQLFRHFFEKSEGFHAHVWLASSGSSKTKDHSTKLIGLSKQGVLAAARAANEHVDSGPQDVWGLALPQFHIGGLAIGARSFLSGARVAEFRSGKWLAKDFHQFLLSQKITLTSLVPTQVFDLVQGGFSSPDSLRAVIVGGGPLASDLYFKARDLGWPLLPSFGMTEMASQVATAEMASLRRRDFPSLKVLSHVEYRITSQGRLGLRGPSVTTGWWQRRSGADFFEAVPPGEYFWSSDLVEEQERGFLKPLGRESEFIKILGEGVHLGKIEDQLRGLIGESVMARSVLVATPDDRRGFNLVFTTELPVQGVSALVEKWNLSCLPVERISFLWNIEQLPKTELGKIQRSVLAELIDPTKLTRLN